METPPAQPPSRQDHESVAKPAPIDLWAGAGAPIIAPESIEKTWPHERDPKRRRATFGVSYPIFEITITKSNDVRTKLPARFEATKRRCVQGIRFHFPVPNIILSEMDFRECKFHRPNEQKESRVLGLTFKDCTFTRCILGGTVFRDITFEDCAFSRSDFGGSQFTECQFLNCTFTECTAENASFYSTEVDPSALLRGTPPPVYNYVSAPLDGEQTAVQVKADWVEVARKLAARLLASNVQIHHTRYSDRGLFELKRTEVKARCEALQAHSLQEGSLRLLLPAIQIFGAWAILKATKGGTSLSRLFLGAMIIVSLYTLLLSYSHVTFMNQDCHLNSIDLWLVLQQLARATSLFLAIGYTAFGGGTLATVLLTAAASLGLFWYALVAAVVIHRVYR